MAIDPKTDTVQYPKQNFNALLYSSLTYRAIRLCFEMSMNSSGALSQKGISKDKRFYFRYCTVSCASFTEFCLKAEILLFFSTKLSIDSKLKVFDKLTLVLDVSKIPAYPSENGYKKS